MSEKRKELVNVLCEQIMGNAEISAYCDQVARESSGTIGWSSEQFEQNEDTSTYSLYWQVYSSTMALLVAEATVQMLPIVNK